MFFFKKNIFLNFGQDDHDESTHDLGTDMMAQGVTAEFSKPTNKNNTLRETMVVTTMSGLWKAS